jgi:hypothetical protein
VKLALNAPVRAFCKAERSGCFRRSENSERLDCLPKRTENFPQMADLYAIQQKIVYRELQLCDKIKFLCTE